MTGPLHISVHKEHVLKNSLQGAYAHCSADDGPEVEIIHKFLDYEILQERYENVLIDGAARDFIEAMCEDFFLQRLTSLISRGHSKHTGLS